MKVKYQESLCYKVKQRLEQLPDGAILRSDIADLGDPRQISRALKTLVQEGYLVKLGYGLYGRLVRSSFANRSYLKGGFLAVARESLYKLNVAWEPSREEQDYNAGRSTQVPANPTTYIKSRFNRKIRYGSMEFKVG